MKRRTHNIQKQDSYAATRYLIDSYCREFSEASFESLYQDIVLKMPNDFYDSMDLVKVKKGVSTYRIGDQSFVTEAGMKYEPLLKKTAILQYVQLHYAATRPYLFSNQHENFATSHSRREWHNILCRDLLAPYLTKFTRNPDREQFNRLGKDIQMLVAKHLSFSDLQAWIATSTENRNRFTPILRLKYMRSYLKRLIFNASLVAGANGVALSLVQKTGGGITRKKQVGDNSTLDGFDLDFEVARLVFTRRFVREENPRFQERYLSQSNEFGAFEVMTCALSGQRELNGQSSTRVTDENETTGKCFSLLYPLSNRTNVGAAKASFSKWFDEKLPRNDQDPFFLLQLYCHNTDNRAVLDFEMDAILETLMEFIVSGGGKNVASYLVFGGGSGGTDQITNGKLDNLINDLGLSKKHLNQFLGQYLASLDYFTLCMSEATESFHNLTFNGLLQRMSFSNTQIMDERYLITRTNVKDYREEENRVANIMNSNVDHPSTTLEQSEFFMDLRSTFLNIEWFDELLKKLRYNPKRIESRISSGSERYEVDKERVDEILNSLSNNDVKNCVFAPVFSKNANTDPLVRLNNTVKQALLKIRYKTLLIMIFEDDDFLHLIPFENVAIVEEDDEASSEEF